MARAATSQMTLISADTNKNVSKVGKLVALYLSGALYNITKHLFVVVTINLNPIPGRAILKVSNRIQ